VVAGDTLLVHAAGSGIGTAVIQIARSTVADATILATAGRQDKLDLAKKLGANEAFNYKEGSFAAKVLNATGGSVFPNQRRRIHALKSWGEGLGIFSFFHASLLVHFFFLPFSSPLVSFPPVSSISFSFSWGQWSLFLSIQFRTPCMGINRCRSPWPNL